MLLRACFESSRSALLALRDEQPTLPQRRDRPSVGESRPLHPCSPARRALPPDRHAPGTGRALLRGPRRYRLALLAAGGSSVADGVGLLPSLATRWNLGAPPRGPAQRRPEAGGARLTAHRRHHGLAARQDAPPRRA